MTTKKKSTVTNTAIQPGWVGLLGDDDGNVLLSLDTEAYLLTPNQLRWLKELLGGFCG